MNYVGKALDLYKTGYELNGSAYVISKYISNTWLWDRVRVSGGAYGGFCDFDSHSGLCLCLSQYAYGENPLSVICFMKIFHVHLSRCNVISFLSGSQFA